MKNILFLLITAALMSGCDHSHEQKAAQPEARFFGEKFDTTGFIKQSDLAALVANGDTVPVKFSAQIVETCTRAGCWMTVKQEGGVPMYIYMADHAFGVPLKGCTDLKAIVNGFAYPDTISVELLKHFAEDAGKSQAEIDAITEPLVGIAATAFGVMIEGYTPTEGSEPPGSHNHEHDHDHEHGHEGH